MVVGGYSPTVPNGLLNDVEIISTKRNNVCTKRARPLPTRFFDVVTHIEKDGARLGMTGKTVFDAPIVCGGQNGEDVQNKCYRYDPVRNKWDNKTAPMIHRRKNADSVIDENGNLWMLGGAFGSDNSDSTEIYNFDRNSWTRGKPLPPFLRGALSFSLALY